MEITISYVGHEDIKIRVLPDETLSGILEIAGKQLGLPASFLRIDHVTLNTKYETGE